MAKLNPLQKSRLHTSYHEKLTTSRGYCVGAEICLPKMHSGLRVPSALWDSPEGNRSPPPGGMGQAGSLHQGPYPFTPWPYPASSQLEGPLAKNQQRPGDSAQEGEPTVSQTSALSSQMPNPSTALPLTKKIMNPRGVPPKWHPSQTLPLCE